MILELWKKYIGMVIALDVCQIKRVAVRVSDGFAINVSTADDKNTFEFMLVLKFGEIVHKNIK